MPKKPVPTSDNVRSISEAIGSLRTKSKKQQRPQRQSIVKEPKEPTLGKGVVAFPQIEGLDEEKTIIGKGIVAINKALFEQSLHEADRLSKIRGILSKIESGLLDEKAIFQLDPIQQLKVFEILRKDCETSVNFLERMQGNSLKVMVVFEIYKKLMETIDDTEEASKGLPADIDKTKVMQVRGALLEMIK